MYTLPVEEVLPEIRSELKRGTRLVLQAPPGAGKTTLVPLSLLDEEWLEGKLIIMLEPRRLAARNAASRMASLLGEPVGERVGYQIKLERRLSKKTKILVVTEGILTRRLQSDPGLEDVALVIFDEFHERSLHADLSLALALQSQELLRADLRLLVMSATLAASEISQLLGDAPVISSEGKSFPVRTTYLDPKIPQPDKKSLIPYMSRVIMELLQEEQGSMLVFLPGAREIRQLEKSITARLRKADPTSVIVAPLYGALSKADQDLAILPAKDGHRKIVLATNIAETSLTIEGITTVIDSGLERVLVYDRSSGMDRLQTVSITEDSAIQRRGRAGRLQAGHCHRLWHKAKPLVKHTRPELLNADLTSMMLDLAQWGVREIEALSWLDLPPKSAIEHAVEVLQGLQMLSVDGTITVHGQAALRLGLHPRLAHMVLKAKALDRTYEASLLAALLSEGDFLRSRGADDITERIRILHAGSFDHHDVDRMKARRILEQAGEYRRRLHGMRTSAHGRDLDVGIIGVLLGYAYPDRVARRRGSKERRYLLSNGKGAILDVESELFGQDYLAVASLDGDRQEAKVYLAASITLEQIEGYFSDQIRQELSVSWNQELSRVESRAKTMFFQLVLKERYSTKAPAEGIASILIEGIHQAGLDVLPWGKEAIRTRARVTFLNSVHSDFPGLFEAETFPDFSDTWLLENLRAWLLPYLDGISDIKGCQRLDMSQLLSAMMTWEQKKLLDDLAPTHITVPSGSKIAIDYSDVNAPVLAVRLQELFGQQETPSLLRGNWKLLIHLLSPAYRPMQITTDLESFWKEAYHDVKKELRGKYKKHYWPDDPLRAEATNRTKKVNR